MTAPAARPSRSGWLSLLLALNLLLILLAVGTTAQRRLHARAAPSRAHGLRRLTALPPAAAAPPLPPPPLPQHRGTVHRPACQLPEDLAPPPPGAPPPLVDISVSSEFGARARRDAIRAGYGAQARALGMRLRFFVGEASASDIGDAWRKQAGSGREGDVGAQLAHEAMARDSEQRQHGDLVILPMADTYANLTKKTLAMAVHTSVCGRGLFFVKTDDDVFVFPWRLARRLAKVQADLAMYKAGLGVYLGSFWENMPPITATDSKNYEPQWAGRGKFFTPFAGGPFYLLSRPVIDFLARNAPFLNTQWRNEDMAMSTWVSGLDVEAVDEERVKLLNWKWSHPPYIALHNIDDREDIEGWHLRQAAANNGPDTAAGA
jgi:hypothetical protein